MLYNPNLKSAVYKLYLNKTEGRGSLFLKFQISQIRADIGLEICWAFVIWKLMFLWKISIIIW